VSFSPDLNRTIRKLEDLPSDGGHAVDVPAGANLRIFVRLKELEQAYRDLTARMRILEERGAPPRPVVDPLVDCSRTPQPGGTRLRNTFDKVRAAAAPAPAK
jgi:hypothetical protein